LMEKAISAPTPIATRHLVETSCKPPAASGCDAESLAPARTPGSICSTIVRYLSELRWPFGVLTQAAPIITDSICRGGMDQGRSSSAGTIKKGRAVSARWTGWSLDVKHRLPNSSLSYHTSQNVVEQRPSTLEPKCLQGRVEGGIWSLSGIPGSSIN